MISVAELKKKARDAKVMYAQMCVEKEKGHLSSGLSCAEIVTVLYYSVLRIDPERPDWSERDRFIMSKNHGMGIVYPILCDLGYFEKSVLDGYHEDGEILGTHSRLNLPGVDYAGGSLGIGLGTACGLSLAARAEEKDWLTFCVLGDCECHEGSVWEAVMLNGEGCTDYMENLIELRPFRHKFEAFSWEVIEIDDGHCIEKLLSGFKDIRTRESNKPLCIIANTVKGNGIPSVFKNKPWMHGQSPIGADGINAIEELNKN
jgi:transketolase